MNASRLSLPARLALLAGLLTAAGLKVEGATLGEALESTNLVWSTPVDGDVPWVAVVTNGGLLTFDGVDSAATDIVGHSKASVLQTTVTGPGTLSFWWRVQSEEGFDFLHFYIDPEVEILERDLISGDQPWAYRSYFISNGTHTLRWRFDRDGSGNLGANKGWLDQVKFKPGPAIPLGTSLNTTYATWTTGGNNNETFWEGQTNVSRADGIAAESGAITTQQESRMETTVWGVTNLSFWWKVSSLTNQGFLKFYVDGVQQFQISGEVGWQLKTNIALTPTAHTLRWATTNSDLAIGKLTQGWVDEVQFSPNFTPPTSVTLSTPILTNASVQFTVTNKLGWPCRVFYSTNLADNAWTLLLDTNMATSATLTVTDPAITNSPSRFYRAVSP
jgi:hypothetical protein